MGNQNKPSLPTDAQGRVIEVPFKPASSLAGTPYSLLSVMTSRLGESNALVRLVATQPAFFNLVSSSGLAAATNHYIPANVPYDVIMKDQDRIAVIGASSTPNGTLYVTVRGA